MDNNSIFALNNAVYQIYNTEDFNEMRREVLRSLRALIPCTFGTIFTAEEGALRDPVCVPERYVEMERSYGSVQEVDFSRWIVEKKQPAIVRASSLMSEEKRMQTDFYRRFYQPYEVHDSIFLTIASGGEFLGLLALYKSREMGDFSEEEQFLLQLMGEHLNVRFCREQRKVAVVSTELKSRYAYIAKYHLTEREAEILGLILSGLDNADIATRLVVSPNTLKKHLQNIYRKIGVGSRIQLLGLLAQ